MIKKVLNFWFNQLTPAQWFAKDFALDQLIIQEFAAIHEQARQGELFDWRQTAAGSLAEIIILDQFSRNMFRGTAQSFAYDGMALILSEEAIRHGHDHALSMTERAFLYMPFMHSESLAIHAQALKLFAVPGLEENLKFEAQHMEIIQQFGRYPHRNVILARESTAAEKDFLKTHTGF